MTATTNAEPRELTRGTDSTPRDSHDGTGTEPRELGERSGDIVVMLTVRVNETIRRLLGRDPGKVLVFVGGRLHAVLTVTDTDTAGNGCANGFVSPTHAISVTFKKRSQPLIVTGSNVRAFRFNLELVSFLSRPNGR
jgi:hypothetical protein